MNLRLSTPSAPVAIVALTVAVALPLVVLACGPFFPNSLLNSGDAAVLQAPAVSFRKELDRLQLEPPPRLAQKNLTGSDREKTADAEIFDLRRALSLQQLPTNEIAGLVLQFSRCRADLEDRRRDRLELLGKDDASVDPPGALELTFPAGIPEEFVLYLRGAAAWHEGRTNVARQFWTDLLALPVAKRPFKTTWATYMLGRSWHDHEPDKSAALYEGARKLTRAGMSDTAGLGVASLGWQGQLRLRTNDLSGALRLYLDQYAAGQPDAALSLTLVSRRIVDASAEVRMAIARDAVARRVITSWVLANHSWAAAWEGDDRETADARNRTHRWLETIEAVGAAEVPLAEQLAVLAYQCGDWEAAARWVELSGESAVAGWIHAKLLLREGRVSEATTELARVVERMPLTTPERARGEAPAFVDSLAGAHDEVPGRSEALGELGVLRITRGEFVRALDALLRGGFWQDAAYVAERVLTVDELKAYVDAEWSGASPQRKAAAAPDDNAHESWEGGYRVEGEDQQRARIRHLLGRRLTRTGRGAEGGGYYPESLRQPQASYLAWMKAGAERSTDRRERARALFHAAHIARTNGLEILGTELAPDYAIWGGEFEEGPTHEFRATNSAARWLKPTAVELRLSEGHHPAPEQRFHYRYTAARLAWDAARLLPNNDPETALVLHTGGSWLKFRDPDTADLFYKALVRRCRRTELGDAADRQRWFPELDDAGHPIVTRNPKNPPAPAEPEIPAAGGEGDPAP